MGEKLNGKQKENGMAGRPYRFYSGNTGLLSCVREDLHRQE